MGLRSCLSGGLGGCPRHDRSAGAKTAAAAGAESGYPHHRTDRAGSRFPFAPPNAGRRSGGPHANVGVDHDVARGGGSPGTGDLLGADIARFSPHPRASLARSHATTRGEESRMSLTQASVPMTFARRLGVADYVELTKPGVTGL